MFSIKRCYSRQKQDIFFKTSKITVFEILAFNFCLEEKRQLYCSRILTYCTYFYEKMKELVFFFNCNLPPNIVRC